MGSAAELLRVASHSLGALLQPIQLVAALHRQLVGSTDLRRCGTRSGSQLLQIGLTRRHQTRHAAVRFATLLSDWKKGK